MSTVREPEDGEISLPLYVEELVVTKQNVTSGRVRVSRTTRTSEAVVNEVLAEERVEVDRVPIGKEVTSMPQVRVEGDTLIIPVVEERLVLERRLVVKEELHVKRIRSERKHRETVMLRKQEAVITRLPAEKTATSKSAELESKCK